MLFKRLGSAKRFKRWDSIGSVWKFIAGSPDADDLRIINSTLNQVIDYNNVQVSINRHINNQLEDLALKTNDVISLLNTKSLEIHSINI